jgi:dTDP-4-dehydrorhamnose reductase
VRVVRAGGRGLRARRHGVPCAPTTVERIARPAPRPAYSVLGTERDATPVLPAWQESVARYLVEKGSDDRT